MSAFSEDLRAAAYLLRDQPGMTGVRVFLERQAQIHEHEEAAGPKLRKPYPAGRSILDEADAVINGDREETYGDAIESFGRISGMWTAYLGARVTPLDAANMMIQLKTSRSRHGYHRDDYVDVAGYAAIGQRIGEA